MQEDGIEAYNSDSGDGEFPVDEMSDENAHGRGDNDGDDDGIVTGWIRWFCALDGHDYMVEVDEAYIRDPFNLYGLQ